MIFGVVGSRSFDNWKLLKQTLDCYIRKDKDIICSGGADGADSLAERYADTYLDSRKIVHEARWQDFSEPCVKKWGRYGAYNALAGHRRNSLIVEDSDIIIAFWNGKSTGTKNTIDKAHKKGIPVVIVNC